MKICYFKHKFKNIIFNFQFYKSIEFRIINILKLFTILDNLLYFFQKSFTIQFLLYLINPKSQIRIKLFKYYLHLVLKQFEFRIYSFQNIQLFLIQICSIQYQDLLYLCKNVKQLFSYYPRPVQLLSEIELFNHCDNKGRLAQIYTGEGKKLIVAMLSVLLCKKKRINVDIVTSSHVLAIRDAKDLSPFYSLFKITVSHNINVSEYKEGILPCYNCQIIYGDTNSFQADILRHEYSELGTMGNRQQGYIIIDEVDSMLIDGNSNKTILSSPNPAMIDLTKVLRLIWDEICKVEPNLLKNKRKVWIESTRQDGNLTVDLEEYIENTLNIQLKDTLKNFFLPFRLDYIHFMKKFWIDSTIQAKFYLQEDVNYKVDKDKVRIIDDQNTGVVHKENMHWQKGLHQFIQLKHQLSVSPLRISTNFISNISYFKRYKSQLLGLTGTLGSKMTQNLLAKQYNVDFIFMSPFKQSLLKQEPGIATLSEEDWLDEILQVVKQQMERKRAIIIINQTINDVNKINKHLEKFNPITYFDDSQEIINKINPETLIVATNLAGRGTDLNKNEELERNGGLHVIMSFLPRNIRIQYQGFGRTARQGKQGTAQLIINFKNNLYCGQMTKIQTIEEAKDYFERQTQRKFSTLFDVLYELRNHNEQEYINEIERDMEKLLKEDRCFQKFQIIAKRKVNIKENRAAFQALEERWGMYVDQYQEKGLDENYIEELLNSNEVGNPKYLVLQGLNNSDFNLINQAAEIQKNDPYASFYKGIGQIRNEDYPGGIKSLQQSKEMFLNKIDDEKGFEMASKLNRMQINQVQNLTDVQNSDQQNLILPNLDFNIQNCPPISFGLQKKDFLDEKINNHIKLYQKAINNIDDMLNTLQNFDQKNEELELSWKPVIEEDEKQDEKQKPDLQQSIKDQEEVMQDGPLPVLCNLLKRKKKRKWWQYVAMFILGLCQFFIGCFICAKTCGLAMPIGRALIKEGISDMVYAVTTAWQKQDINWRSWGQQKGITIATTLAFAGPAAISEALKIGGQGFKSLQKMGINDFLKQIPAVTSEGLQKAIYWLPKSQQNYIEGQYDTLKQVSQVASITDNKQNILRLAEDIISDQVQRKTITQETATEIQDIVKQNFEQSQGSTEALSNSFNQIAKKYIRFKMAQSKSEEDPKLFKQNGEQIFIQKRDNVKRDIEQYDQLEKDLQQNLESFSNNIMNIYSNDQYLQKYLTAIEFFYKSQNNLKALCKELMQSFRAQKKDYQKECQNLQLTDPKSNQEFYEKVIRLSIYQFCQSKTLYAEPLYLIFLKEYENQYNIQLEEIQKMKEELDEQSRIIDQQKQSYNYLNGNATQLNRSIDDYNNKSQNFNQSKDRLREVNQFEYQQFAKNIITHMYDRKIINHDGISFSESSFMQEFNIYLNKQNQNVIQFIEKIIKNCFDQIGVYKSQKHKSKLSSAIIIEMLEEIEQFIYQSKLKDADNKIRKKIFD
ncbi:unnamed protein product [Paramecium sonneborni]|uniref:Protein translocase subunit SecA n=1 Tax=Paramecium sonneborni TaxID=65129 RepID=A0A8S1R8P3_9CILI|nr:unnamed protein product [Paramecium sonneborni]